MAFQTGMLCIVIISLTSFVLAFQTSNLFSKTIQTKSKASSLLLKAVLAVLVLLHSGVTFTWIVFYYLKQGGWSYDRMTGVCTDPKGLNLAFNEMMETMKPEFYVALIGTILYVVCFGIATYCYVSLRKQSSFSYVQVLRSTPNFGRFYFSLAMIVTLNVVVLIVGAAAAIWFTLAVLSINAALVIRIMLGEEVVKGETTSLTLKEADQNGKSQIVNQHHNNSSEGSELLERNGVKTSGVGSDLETLTLRNGSRSLKDGPMTPNVETTLPIL